MQFSQNKFYPKELRRLAVNSATEAATYYTKNCVDSTEDGIVFWYSSLKQHSFHVTNATAMMAGQLQRLASAVSDNELFINSSDAAIEHLLNLKETYRDGWGWNYFGNKIPLNKKNKTNDLLHEAFVCHGLLDYKYFGGSRGTKYRYIDLYNSLCRFQRDGRAFEFSAAENIQSRKKHRARALAMGHALYIAARLEPLLEESPRVNLSQLFYTSLCNEYIQNYSLFHRPEGENVTQRVRVISHVLLGIGEYSRLINQSR